MITHDYRLADYSKMPVYHRLLWTPEIKGEEHHGPINGVRPCDYSEAYEYLMELRCVMTLENQLYQDINTNNNKVYTTCYNNTPDEHKNICTCGTTQLGTQRFSRPPNSLHLLQ